MRLSVIIPVYNAAEYLEQAVESALAQPETREVVLVEDGSQDDSLVVCRALAEAHPRVKLYRHPDGENHGQAASQNLGIRKSTCDYVAFLDADDWYLPGRFVVAQEILAAVPNLDGVYEAFGEHVESETAGRQWEASGRPRGLTTMTKRVPPDELFWTLVPGGHGHFHVSCMVVRREIFDKTGLFDEHLGQAEDTAMIFKMAAVARLAPGRLDEPVAVRRIHERNRSIITQRERYESWMGVFSTVWRWYRGNSIDREKREALLERFLDYAVYSRLDRTRPRWTHGLQKKLWLGLLLLRYPLLALELYFWERFAPERMVKRYRRMRSSSELS